MILKRWMLAAILIFCGINVCLAQQDNSYVKPDDVPNATYFLPIHPDSVSPEFTDDLIQWEWGKTQRDTKRGEKAIREQQNASNVMRGILAEVLELSEISNDKTPALSKLLEKCYNTGGLSTQNAKDYYMRSRPFMMMNEQAWGECGNEEEMRHEGSFPSYHTAFGWAVSLAFAEMWPALQDTILCRGFEFGENQIIAGANWQSDVNAGYLCGAAIIARAHCNPEFEADIAAARAEYAQLKGLSADYDPVEGVDVPHGEKFLNDPVDTASYRYISDLTLYWHAFPQRTTERGKQAAEEAEYSVSMMQKVFREAMNLPLSDEGTPKITALIAAVLEKSSETADRLKPIRFRKRPFVQLGQPSFVPGDEEKERGKSSFPSGHTNLGWTEALVLAEVAPDCQNEILRRGYQYGYNRLIVGYHWFTDIEATRMLSSGLVARLHADPVFRQLIADAQAEYAHLTGTTTLSSPLKEDKRGTAYRLDGMPAKDGTFGIVIEEGKKIMKR